MVEPIFPTSSSSSLPRPVVSDQLVTTYHYLCFRGAHKFWRTGLERSDLEQVAAIGLIKASHRYDPRTRTPFEAYAWLIIVGELMHYVRDHERIVRIPRRLQVLERRFVRAHDTLMLRLGAEPTDTEIAAEIGVVVRTVADVRRARNSATQATLDEIETRSLRAQETLALEDRLLFDSAFAALGELERRIIVGIYVLGLTQLEMGRRLGITPKHVSRVHRAALRSMQRAWVS